MRNATVARHVCAMRYTICECREPSGNSRLVVAKLNFLAHQDIQPSNLGYHFVLLLLELQRVSKNLAFHSSAQLVDGKLLTSAGTHLDKESNIEYALKNTGMIFKVALA